MKYLLISLACVLSACSLNPKLDLPAPPIPQRFAGADVTRTQAVGFDWHSVFRDARLERLIELSLTSNRDLRIAILNVDAYRAQHGIQAAERLPSISASTSATRERVSGNAGLGTPAAVQNMRSAGLAVSAFELDAFGRLRSMSEAAFARYVASDEGRRSAEIALVSAVADAYFQERLAENQLKLAQDTLHDWHQALKLAHLQMQARQVSGLDVAQAEGQVATAEADLQERTREVAKAANALRLLVGAEFPADLPDPLAMEDLPVVTTLPAGLPSDVIARRPDIRQAERNLVAANAEIGAARAAFFPSITLTSSLGYSSTSMGNLFDRGSRTWQFMPQISVPIFNGGRLKAELNLAEIRKSVAIAEYEKAIQTAFREVSDGLAGQETYSKQIAAQKRTVEHAEKRQKLAGLRQRFGVDGRLELLDAQRQLYAAQQSLLELRKDEISNAIALYKALGGSRERR